MNKVICGNCVDVMAAFPDNYIDLTITSPPYDNLRDYNGYDFDFEGIANQLYRITKQGGVVVWVVGDATIKGSETGTSFKQALYFKEVGFSLHDTMIYAKENYIPLTHNRYEQQFEYMFVLSKGKPQTFNPIMKSNKQAGRENINNRFRQDKDNQGKRHKDDGVKVESIKPNIFYYYVGSGSSTKDKIAFQHPAIFPEQLASDQIITWSDYGELVFDPMCGSGTTCKMAVVNNRNFIGIDISEEYCEIARKRIAEHEHQLALI